MKGKSWKTTNPPCWAVLRITTHLRRIRIRILFFIFKQIQIQIRIQLFNLIQIRFRIRHFFTDLDHDRYRLKEVIYLKQYILHTFTWYSLSLGPTRSTKKGFFVKFSLTFIFFVLYNNLRIRILATRRNVSASWCYGSLWIRLLLRICNTDGGAS